MITISNFREVLENLGFTHINDIYTKEFADLGCELVVDFNKKRLRYPDNLTVHESQICNFQSAENFVVFECVHRLLEKGYQPNDIELEKRWTLGHTAKGGRADICVKDNYNNSNLMIIECKTYGTEYRKALETLKADGGQLFSYLQQERSTKWIALYTSSYINGKLSYKNDIIATFDDLNILELAKQDPTMKLYENAHSVNDLFLTWKETYGSKMWEGLFFGEDTSAYNIGVKPLRKKDLKDFTPEDKVVNRFEEILRHNNVSDKENAFNRLVALFICKLVDEIEKNDEDIVDFQYKQGTDSYESLQDRLQRLHKDGMEKFMKEETFYISADYPEKLFQNYTGQYRKKAIEDLKEKFKMLKFYSNNDFAFKDVHNEELFLQNGKVLVEMVQLFEKYRIVYKSRHKFLGDLFEQLLNKGFKQNEGQFFTPTPITSFIWDSLPLEKLQAKNEGAKYPKVIDYACGAGHFLVDGIEAINKAYGSSNNDWVLESIYGIEKDYRLARVSKISLFMNGAGDGNIIFGDGLDNNKSKGIDEGSFDILVANPPYSVAAFKSHLKLKNNNFHLIDRISNEGGEIEVLFIERIAQLLKPKGLGAVILPSSVLSNSSNSYVGAREELLRNFKIKAIVQLGSHTFSATGTNTVVLFLEKFDEPPKKQDLIEDSIESIFNKNSSIQDWEDKEILEHYLEELGVEFDLYKSFIDREGTRHEFLNDEYFELYLSEFEKSAPYKRLTKKNLFKKLSQNKQELAIDKAFFDFVQKTEKDKIFYFSLIYKQKTVVVVAPKDTAKQKEFLGYEWSKRKGQEGIKILNSGMLFDESNRGNIEKVSYWIRESYLNEELNYIDFGSDILKAIETKKMFDFNRTTFNKSINLSLHEPFKPNSAYPIVNLGKFGTNTTILKGTSITRADTVKGAYKVVAGGMEYAYKHDQFNRIAPIITISASGANAGFVSLWNENIFASDCTTIKTDSDTEVKYIYYYLKTYQSEVLKLARGAAQPHVYPNDISAFLIPNAPKNIQKEVVLKCEDVEKSVQTIRTTIDGLEEEIESIFRVLDSEAISSNTLKLNNQKIFQLSIGKRVLRKDVSENFSIPVYSANVFEPFGRINQLLIEDFSIPSIIWGIDGDWMVNMLPKDYEFYPTDHCGVLRVDETKVHPRYMAHVLEREGERIGFSRSHRASLDRIKGISFAAPNISIQNAKMEEVLQLEEKIKKLKEELSSHFEEISDIVKRLLILEDKQ